LVSLQDRSGVSQSGTTNHATNDLFGEINYKYQALYGQVSLIHKLLKFSKQ
jgi:hypothetical protein